LSLVGGAAGLLIALWGIDFLLAIGPADLPRVGAVRIDGGVLVFSLLVSVATGAAFGLLPALSASHVDVHESLRSGVRTSSGRHPRRLRRVLVVAEVALALVLLCGAGVLLRSFANVLRVEPGFRPDEVLSFRMSLSTPDAKQTAEDDARYARIFAE